jgi:hypothetical protein
MRYLLTEPKLRFSYEKAIYIPLIKNLMRLGLPGIIQLFAEWGFYESMVIIAGYLSL